MVFPFDAHDLAAALGRREFFLEFQPQVRASTSAATGAEALVRWRRPGGIVPPLQFIPVAEKSGFISTLGFWVLDQALAAACLWPPSWSLSVNVSSRQMEQTTFPDEVKRALARRGFPAPRLTLEMTESLVIDQPDRTRDVLVRLRKSGVRIALDDFGTGYSSLLHVRDFPLDELKVDRAFVTSLEEHRESAVLVDSILRLAQSLGLATTAEGVENRRQAEILTTLGCDNLQGYLFSPPVSDPLVPFPPGPHPTPGL